MNICIFGDSITWGAYDPEGGGWATRLRNYFEAQNKDINVYNLGISGDSTVDLINRIEGETKSREPDLIVFAIGINDAQFIHSTNGPRISAAKFRGNLEKIFSVAKKFTDKIVFVGLTCVDESKTHPWDEEKSYTNDIIRRFDGEIEEFCATNNLGFITVNDAIGMDDLIDGLHPNTTGHTKLLGRIKPRLEKLLINQGNIE